MQIRTRQYSLDLTIHKKSTIMVMKMTSSILSTEELPLTHTILRKQLPGVLKTRCFNSLRLPFTKEVRQTEIGHLFEHILLQNMLEMKLALGDEKFVLKGTTSWDWKKDSRGTFHIKLNVGAEEQYILYSALDKSNQLLDHIFEMHESLSTPTENRDPKISIFMES